MLGSLLLVTDLLFDGMGVIVTVVVAAVVCVACWCVLPALRRRQLMRRRIRAVR
jgi:hypothetical protein